MRALLLAVALVALAACQDRTASGLEAPTAPVEVGGLDARVPRVDAPPVVPAESVYAPRVPAQTPRPPRLAVRTALAPFSSTSVSELLLVQVDVEVEGAAGPAELSAEFVAPGGVVFHRQVHTLPGTVFEVQQAHFELPVAGTVVDHAGLSGGWEVRLFLGGAQVDARSFGLTP